MLDTNLEPLPHSLDCECPIPWPADQESKIGTDYPFTDYVEETLEEYVIQRYLETLWLPDSVTCLIRFVKDLRRIRISPEDTNPQDLIGPLLLSVDAIRQKYHVQLPRVIQEEGGAGEIEETMMWFAYGNERYHRKDQGAADESESGEATKEWLTRMEYRELKIQILLCLHLLSARKQETSRLNPPAINIIPSTPAKKGAKTAARTKGPVLRSSLSPKKPIFPPTNSTSVGRGKTKDGVRISQDQPQKQSHHDIEERLELLMDRLSIAQLVANLPTHPLGPSQPSTSTAVPTNKVSQDPQRDWIQAFCEEIVKPLFQGSLPAFYDLFHSKVFPHSPFSEESDNAAPSPVIRTQKKFKAKERCPPSPLKLHEVTTRAAVASSKTRTTTSGAKRSGTRQESQISSLQRHRSRSVSVSVEEVRARGARRGGVASSKALFQGEFEMKRSLSKSGGKLFQSSSTLAKVKIEDKARGIAITEPSKREESKSKTLVFDTPVKKLFRPPVALITKNPEDKGKRVEFVTGDEFVWSSEEDNGGNSNNRTQSQIFVMDTPVKNRTIGD